MNRTDWRAFIRREIVLFIQYAVIASLAASTAHDTLWLSDFRERDSSQMGEFCLHGFIKAWITRFWFPWFKAFLPLALTRTIFGALAFWYRGRIARRTGDTVQIGEEFSLRGEIRSFVGYCLVSFAALTHVLIFYVQDARHNSWAWLAQFPRSLSESAGVFEFVKIFGERFYGPGLATFVFLALARLLAVFVVRKLLRRRDRA